MSQAPQIKFAKIALPAKGPVTIALEDTSKLSGILGKLDDLSNGQIKRAFRMSDFKAKKKTFLDLIVPAGLELSRLIFLGIGDSKKRTSQDWLHFGGATFAKLANGTSLDATVILSSKEGTDTLAPDAAAHFGLGMILRSYKFEKYKSKTENKGSKSKKELKRITIQCENPSHSKALFDSLQAIGEGIFLARDLINEPANKLGPGEFAKKVKTLDRLGVEVEILGEKALEKLGAHALLGVGLGSAKPTFLVVMKWFGARSKKTKPIAFIGKGVTFDSGGISIKPAGGMENMKGDMGGAACVCGLIHALAARKAKVNAIGVIGLTENMVSSQAQRPGDIVTAMSGKTIEILNTDAEGRLVLADALWYTQERFTPQLMIDLATLTGAILVALGKEYAGLFSNDDTLAAQLSKAGETSGEKVWRLPLGSEYDKMIESKNADIKNIGGRYAGATTAAQFLQHFVNDLPWAHLDIAGTAMSSPRTDINTSWGAGYGVRLLNQFIADNYED